MNEPSISPDQPGQNTDLRPSHAPAWLKKAVTETDMNRVRGAVGRRRLPQRSARSSAVLMLFSGDPHARELPADAGIVLTHRSPGMRSHPGQMAFPGGRVDDTDTNIVDTALREGWEETGLDRMSVTPLLQLDPVQAGNDGHSVYPVAAYRDELGELWPASPMETDDVFTASIAELVDPANRLTVGWNAYRGPAFKVRGYVVWGLTGGLIASVIEAAGWENEWDRDAIAELREVLAASRNNERHY